MNARSRGALILLPALILPLGCGRHAADAPDAGSTAHPAVRVVAIESHVFRGEIQAPGQWKAATETVIQAPFDAIVDSVRVRPGDAVTRGETLGGWRTYESEAALRGAELLVEQARDPAAASEAARALHDARASMVRVPIVSPVSGIVLRRQADDGSRLIAGAEVLALVAYDAVVFEARIPGESRGLVRPGMSATLESPNESDRPARVWTVLPATAGDQSALAWLRASTPGGLPEISRFGTARIATGRQSTSLAVPDSAVVEDDLTGRHRVAVVDSLGRVAWFDVALGLHEGAARGVSGPGLRAGLRVVVEGQRALIEGVEVSPEP